MPVSGARIRRAIAIVAIVFAAVFVVGALGTTGLFSLSTHPVRTGEVIAGGANLAFLAAAIACILVSLPFSRALRDASGRDIGRGVTLAKVVLRGRSSPLDDAGQRAAVRYALLAPTALAFQLGYVVLLYIGLGFQQLASMIDGDHDALPLSFLLVLGVVLVVIIPLFVARIRRARRYADEHGAALDAATAPV
jgi:hypothetical protein